MPFKLNPVTGKLDLVNSSAPTNATYITQTPNGSLSAEQALSTLATGYVKNTTTTGVLSVQAVPIPVTDGGTGTVTAFTQGSIPFAGATGAHAQDNTNLNFNDTTNIFTTSNINLVTGTNTYYVATTGSDSNDGLAVGTPFLTIEKALNTIPLFNGGIATVNIADGTYTLAAAYTTRGIVSSAGNSDYSTVVKVVGNTTTPANVVINGFSASTVAFNINSPSTCYDFDGVTINAAANAFAIGEQGFLILRAVAFTNMSSTGPVIQCFGKLVWKDGTGGRTIQTVNNVGGIFVQRYGTFELECNLTFTGMKNNSCILVGGYGRFIQQSTSTSITMTADQTGTGGSRGLFFTGNATGTIRNAWTFDQFNNASGTAFGAVTVGGYCAVSIVSGATFTITDSTIGICLQPFSQWNESGACTYAISTTTTPVQIQHSAQADSSNSFSSNTISYLEGEFTFHGYDGRYVESNGSNVYAASSAASDTYAVTLSPAALAYANGQEVRFKADVGNTGAATLNVNGLGAISITKKGNTPLTDGDIEANQIVSVIYNSTGPVFEMQSQQAATIPIADGGTGQTTAVAAFDALAPTTTLGDTIYHDGTDNVRLAGNITTTQKFLAQTGSGAASAAPSWVAVPPSLTWTEVTGATQNIAVANAYIANNGAGVTFTIPAAAAVGDVFRVVGKSTGLFLLAQAAGQTIHFGSSNTTTGAGGSVTATNRYDAIELVCTIANTDFTVMSSVGSFTIA